MRIAVVQMTSGIDPAVNAATLEAAIEEAAAGSAAMLFAPEMAGLLDSNTARVAASIATEDEDAVLARVRAAAARARLWVHLGSLAIATGAADRRWANRGFVIDGAGGIAARYDKMHLFDVDLASGESWRESARYAPGTAPTVVDTPVGRLGLAICYDMRFPALFQALSAGGAQILSVPAAFTVPTGRAHWHTLLRARAIENACFLVAAAQSGDHEDGRATYGHSLVVDPWGDVLLDMGEGSGVAFADIDPARVEAVRGRVPVIAHRRPIGPVA